MTVDYERLGTSSGSSVATPLANLAHNATVNAGDMALLVLTTRSSTGAAATGPGGSWVEVGTVNGGAGTWGAGTGDARTTVYYLECAGTEDSAAVSCAWDRGGDANYSAYAQIIYFSKTEAAWVAPVCVTGTVGTADTSWDMTADASLAMADNDLVVAIASATLEGAGVIGRSISASGVTFGTLTSRSNNENANGYDAVQFIDTAPVTTGVTAVPTHSLTWTGGNEAGSGMVIRLRESAGGAGQPPRSMQQHRLRRQ